MNEVTQEQEASRQRLLELIVLGTDLSKLKDDDRVQYYKEVCESVGLNPLTRPLEFLTLDGKTVLYARKDCTDQLRSIHHVSVSVTGRESIGSVFTVTARATMPGGRTDESIGAVSTVYPEKYKTKEGWKPHPKGGKTLDAAELAVALMKAETKAKRRVTLSIVGLGVLDETEIDDIPPVIPEQAPATIPGPVAKEPAKVADTEPAQPSTASVQTAPSTAPSQEGVGQGEVATGTASPKQEAKEDPPLSDGRKRIFRAKMATKKLTEADIEKKFGATLDNLKASQSADVQAYIESQ